METTATIPLRPITVTTMEVAVKAAMMTINLLHKTTINTEVGTKSTIPNRVMTADITVGIGILDTKTTEVIMIDTTKTVMANGTIETTMTEVDTIKVHGMTMAEVDIVEAIEVGETAEIMVMEEGGIVEETTTTVTEEAAATSSAVATKGRVTITMIVIAGDSRSHITNKYSFAIMLASIPINETMLQNLRHVLRFFLARALLNHALIFEIGFVTDLFSS